MSNDQFQINDSLTYAAPDRVIDGDISWVSFKPTSIGTYLPGQSIDFKLRSNNEFVVLDRSYIKFTYAESGSVTTGSALCTAGASAFFSQVTDTVSGLQLPLCKNWNVQNAMKLATDTTSRQTITTRCEYYGAAAASPTTTARTVCMPIPTTLASSTKIIPLAVLQGGWSLNYQLAPYLTAYNSANASNSYGITNMEIVCCMIKPTDAYLGELSSALSRGGSLKLPLELTKNITQSLTTATTQSIRLQTGFLGSVNSIFCTYRPLTDVNVVSKDSMKSTMAKVSEFYLNVNSQRYPRNTAIGVSTPEYLYQLLAGYNTSLSVLSVPAAQATADIIKYSWKTNQEFSSGIPLNDGQIGVELSFSSAPASGDYFDAFINYDALLVIGQSDVQLQLNV
jgi:hypothetical protein